MLLMTVSSRSRCRRTSSTRPVTESAIVLELARQPRNRVRPSRRYATLEITAGDQARRGFEALKSLQDDEPDNEARSRRSAPAPARRCGDHPADVARHRGADLLSVKVEDQDPVDSLFRVVALVARFAVGKRNDRPKERTAARPR